MALYEGNLWHGDLVRLAAITKDDFAPLAAMTLHSASQRLMASGPVVPQTAEQVEAWIGRVQQSSNEYQFAIRTLADDVLVGMGGLNDIEWANGVCELGIGIADPAQWGKGYGHDAMRLLLRTAFSELNLHRVGLGVFAYNERAIALYERMGFVLEGIERERIHRDGSRHDLRFYGLLRNEWESTL